MAYLYKGIIMKKRIDKRRVRRAKLTRRGLANSLKKRILKVLLFIRVEDVRVYPLYLINYFKVILSKKQSRY